MLTDSEKTLLLILTHAVAGKSRSVTLRSADFAAVFAIAKQNKVLPFLPKVLDTNGLSDHQRAFVEQFYYRSMAKDARQQHLMDLLTCLLEDYGIAHGFMKGAILKSDYPDPVLRDMSDIDVYLSADDRRRAVELMPRIAAHRCGHDGGDLSYMVKGVGTVELHSRLLYRKEKRGVICYNAEGLLDRQANQLTEEAFALNMIGHMIYDFATSGMCARMITDLYVYRTYHRPQPDWQYVLARLYQDGIGEIAENLIELSECWFAQRPMSDRMEELGAAVLRFNAVDADTRALQNNISMGRGKLGALRFQFFRTRDEFENRYPWLKRHPALLPAAWVLRLAQSLVHNPGFVWAWIKRLFRTDLSAVKEETERLKKFGL